MKRRILLVDDELAILLTLKAVLEISGFDVETASSAREAKMKLRTHDYHMVITDMRMESDTAGMEVVAAARKAPCRPAVAMLTAFPLREADEEDGADTMLVKPMNTGDLLRQVEALLVTHEDSKRKNGDAARKTASKAAVQKTGSRAAAGKPMPPQKAIAKAQSGRVAQAR